MLYAENLPGNDLNSLAQDISLNGLQEQDLHNNTFTGAVDDDDDDFDDEDEDDDDAEVLDETSEAEPEVIVDDEDLEENDLDDDDIEDIEWDDDEEEDDDDDDVV